jgi:flavin reductase (DIM6/NTAB) family NADH-FMN oxidoreductase RutF
MEKINMGANVFVYPMPVTLLGTKMDNKANFMALGWISRVNSNPPLLAVGVNRNHHSNQNIRKNRTFSVNFPSAELIMETDYCGLVSGGDVDKSKLFQVFYGELETAPMIRECPLSMECRLVDTHEMATNDLFIGEIMASYSEEQYMTNGKIDIKKINPLLLTMPDNHYWTVGDKVGKAWSIGRELKE